MKDPYVAVVKAGTSHLKSSQHSSSLDNVTIDGDPALHTQTAVRDLLSSLPSLSEILSEERS